MPTFRLRPFSTLWREAGKEFLLSVVGTSVNTGPFSTAALRLLSVHGSWLCPHLGQLQIQFVKEASKWSHGLGFVFIALSAEWSLNYTGLGATISFSLRQKTHSIEVVCISICAAWRQIE